MNAGSRLRGGRSRAFFIMYALLALCGLWPVVAIFNRPALFLGLPLLEVWSFFVAIATAAAMFLAYIRED
jgi:nitrate reductase NapE component